MLRTPLKALQEEFKERIEIALADIWLTRELAVSWNDALLRRTRTSTRGVTEFAEAVLVQLRLGRDESLYSLAAELCGVEESAPSKAYELLQRGFRQLRGQEPSPARRISMGQAWIDELLAATRDSRSYDEAAHDLRLLVRLTGLVLRVSIQHDVPVGRRVSRIISDFDRGFEEGILRELYGEIRTGTYEPLGRT